MAFQLLWGLLSLLALVLVLWLEKVKKKDSHSELEKESVPPWQLDSRLAQELSLFRLRQEQELEKSQLEQRRTAQE